MRGSSMKDGKLRIRIEDGQIRAVAANAGLDYAYQRLFETARDELRGSDTPIEVGIRLIVFGCFWLEAVCNETVRELLRAAMKPPAVAEATWEAIKRAPFHTKLQLASAFAKSPDPGRERKVASDLKRPFELRNRLAHFKDEDAPVAGPLTLNEFQEQFEEFPDADLIEKFRQPSADVSTQAILAGIGWLNEIRQEHLPSTTHSLDGAAAEDER